MDFFVDSEKRKQPEKVSDFIGGWFFLPFFRNRVGGVPESIDFTANSAENVVKNIEIITVLRYTVGMSFV